MLSKKRKKKRIKNTVKDNLVFKGQEDKRTREFQSSIIPEDTKERDFEKKVKAKKC